jgi:hypothetical protein
MGKKVIFLKWGDVRDDDNKAFVFQVGKTVKSTIFGDQGKNGKSRFT